MAQPRKNSSSLPSLSLEQGYALLLLISCAIVIFQLLQQRLTIKYRLNAPAQQSYTKYGRVLQAQTAEPEISPTSGTTSVDDDPVLGSATAPITMVAFVDYECPFCRRFFLEILPQLKEKFVATGQLKIVFRDLPIPYHEPVATLEALSVNCARQQGGDAAFFAFQEQIYKHTRSNGSGLKNTDVEGIAEDLGLKSIRFQLCLAEPAIMEEITKDVAAADALQVMGTPTFLIGKSTPDGIVTGPMILGAQTVAAFETVINQTAQ